MKKVLTSSILLFITLTLCAQISKTVNINAGELSTTLTTTEINTVTDLTITGKIDSRDFLTMRKMSALAKIDLSGTSIEAYTGTRGTLGPNSNYIYAANVVPENAFYDGLTGKGSLINITLPTTTNSIGNQAFYNTGLKSIVIPNSVISIGDQAFSVCSGLTSLTIPNSVISIGAFAFYGINISSLVIPSSVTSIGEYAFTSCMSLTSIVLPTSITSIKNNTFASCINLSSVEIPSSVISIGDYAFDNCKSLTSIIIPNSVTSIGNNAFSMCDKLTTVKLPASISSVGDWAFYSCYSLTSIYVYSMTPVSLPANVFAFASVNSCILYVPAGSKNAYEGSPIWYNFNIVEFTPTIVNTLLSSTFKTTLKNGQLEISGAEKGYKLYVYNLQGLLITTQFLDNEKMTVNLPRNGVYILRVTTNKGNFETKVVK